MSTIDLARQAQTDDAAQRFWALVLLVAVKDGASEVRFVPKRGKGRLTYKIEGTEYDLLPPPRFLMADIERAARQMLCPQTLWSRLTDCFGRARRPAYTGTFSAKVGEHRVTVKGAADADQARVVLKLAPSPSMVTAAQTAWQAVRATRTFAELGAAPDLAGM